MTKEDFDDLMIGDFVVSGKDHLVQVSDKTSNAVVYYENGYYHEVCLENITNVMKVRVPKK